MRFNNTYEQCANKTTLKSRRKCTSRTRQSQKWSNTTTIKPIKLAALNCSILGLNATTDTNDTLCSFNSTIYHYQSSTPAGYIVLGVILLLLFLTIFAIYARVKLGSDLARIRQENNESDARARQTV